MGLNVILATLGSAGDVNPFIAIGKGMVARGHTATLVTNPHFESVARQAGLAFAGVHTVEDYARVTNDPDLWRPIRGLMLLSREIVVRSLEPVFETIRQLNRPGETIVVATGLTFGARIANEVLGVPLVTVFLQPFCTRSLIAPPEMPFGKLARLLGRPGTRGLYRVGDSLFDRVVAGPTNAYRRTFGLPPERRLMNRWWMSPQRVLGVWPDWFAPPQPDWPEAVRLADFVVHNAPPQRSQACEADAFFSNGTPPIVFTPGTAMRHGRDFLAAGAQACEILRRRGVLVTPYPEHVPKRLPDQVVHLPYVPFGTFLPRAGAIVHHGGMGTSAEAMQSGIPQVVRPMGYDQFDNAARLERLGVGAAIPRSRFRARRLAHVLDRLLSSDGVVSRAQELASRMDRARGVQLACEAIEQTAADADRRTHVPTAESALP